MTNVDLYCELINSYVISLVEAIGKEQELKVISFCLFQLPTLVLAIKEKIKGIYFILNQPFFVFVCICLF